MRCFNHKVIVRESYLDSRSLHHPRNLLDRSNGKCQLRSHNERFSRKEIEHIRCSLHILSTWHRRRNLQGSRSDDRPQGLYIKRRVHMLLGTSTRWYRYNHRMGCLRNHRGTDKCNFRENWDNPHWFHRHLVAHIRRYPCTALLHLPGNLVCICMQNVREDCSIQRFQRIVRQLTDLDIRQCLKEVQY